MVQKTLNNYVVCHDCQLTGGGIRNCAHPNECGSTKEYPKELRKMIEDNHNLKIPLSIIAERAFDMGKKKIINHSTCSCYLCFNKK